MNCKFIDSQYFENGNKMSWNDIVLNVNSWMYCFINFGSQYRTPRFELEVDRREYVFLKADWLFLLVYLVVSVFSS